MSALVEFLTGGPARTPRVARAQVARSGPRCCTAPEESSACERALSEYEQSDRSPKAFGRTRLSLAALLGALCVALLVAAHPAAAQERAKLPVLRYKLTLVGEMDPVHFFDPTDLNNRGEVSGFVLMGPGTRAVVWDHGNFTVLQGFESSQDTFANGINDLGDVCGRVSVGAFRVGHGAIWHQGEIIDLGAPSEDLQVEALRINNRGEVLARVSNGDYLWARGTFTPVGPVGGGGVFTTDLNNRGEVVGNQSIGMEARAVLWRDGTVEVLDMLPGAQGSIANSLNDFGQVVGQSYGGGPERAFLWKDGQTRALPNLYDDADDSGDAQAINNWGQIVGREMHLGVFVPVLWQFGRPHDLNELISKDDPLQPYVTLHTPLRINDRGQILVWGNDSRSGFGDWLQFPYLLTPVLP